MEGVPDEVPLIVPVLVKPADYTSIGRRAFSYTAPYAIPLNIRLSPSVSSFKHNRKTHYSAAAFNPATCHQ